MPQNCCVDQCHTNSEKNPELSFFQVPKEIKTRKNWQGRIRRAGGGLPYSAKVCSRHFLPSDFRAPNLNTPEQFRKRTLRKGVVPCLNLRGHEMNDENVPGGSSTLIEVMYPDVEVDGRKDWQFEVEKLHQKLLSSHHNTEDLGNSQEHAGSLENDVNDISETGNETLYVEVLPSENLRRKWHLSCRRNGKRDLKRSRPGMTWKKGRISEYLVSIPYSWEPEQTLTLAPHHQQLVDQYMVQCKLQQQHLKIEIKSEETEDNDEPIPHYSVLGTLYSEDNIAADHFESKFPIAPEEIKTEDLDELISHSDQLPIITGTSIQASKLCHKEVSRHCCLTKSFNSPINMSHKLVLNMGL